MTVGILREPTHSVFSSSTTTNQCENLPCSPTTPHALRSCNDDPLCLLEQQRKAVRWLRELGLLATIFPPLSSSFCYSMIVDLRSITKTTARGLCQIFFVVATYTNKTAHFFHGWNQYDSNHHQCLYVRYYYSLSSTFNATSCQPVIFCIK